MVREPDNEARALLAELPHGASDREEAAIFADSRERLCTNVIAPSLERGQIVFSDRSINSSIVMQGMVGRLGVEAIETINSPYLKLEKDVRSRFPVLTVFLHAPFEELLSRREQRGDSDRFEDRPESYHRNVYDAYSQRAEAMEWAIIPADSKAETWMQMLRILHEIESVAT